MKTVEQLVDELVYRTRTYQSVCGPAIRGRGILTAMDCARSMDLARLALLNRVKQPEETDEQNL